MPPKKLQPSKWPFPASGSGPGTSVEAEVVEAVVVVVGFRLVVVSGVVVVVVMVVVVSVAVVVVTSVVVDVSDVVVLGSEGVDDVVGGKVVSSPDPAQDLVSLNISG